MKKVLKEDYYRSSPLPVGGGHAGLVDPLNKPTLTFDDILKNATDNINQSRPILQAYPLQALAEDVGIAVQKTEAVIDKLKTARDTNVIFASKKDHITKIIDELAKVGSKYKDVIKVLNSLENV